MISGPPVQKPHTWFLDGRQSFVTRLELNRDFTSLFLYVFPSSSFPYRAYAVRRKTDVLPRKDQSSRSVAGHGRRFSDGLSHGRPLTKGGYLLDGLVLLTQFATYVLRWYFVFFKATDALMFASAPDPFRAEGSRDGNGRSPVCCGRFDGGAVAAHLHCALVNVQCVKARFPLCRFLRQGRSVTPHTFSCPIESHLFMVTSVECKSRWVGQLGVGGWKSRSHRDAVGRQLSRPVYDEHCRPSGSSNRTSWRSFCVQRPVRSTGRSTALHTLKRWPSPPGTM